MTREEEIKATIEFLESIPDGCDFDRFGHIPRLANQLYDAGWHKQIEAKWVKMDYSDDYKCSHCTYIHCDGEELRRNPQHFLYCGHCGAKMKLKEK